MEQLLEWTENYLKNRDLTLRKIVSMDVNEKELVIDVKFRDKNVKHHIFPVLSDSVFALAAGPKVVICNNSSSNFNFLIKHWSKFSKLKDFSMIFVSKDDKWQVNPYVHQLIADPESLETGLKAMFDAANGDIKDLKPEKKKPKIFDDDVADEE